MAKRISVKRTTVSFEEEIERRDREGFISVCCYGAESSKEIEENEIGAIVKNPRNYRIENGLWTFDVDFVERIFVEPKEGK